MIDEYTYPKPSIRLAYTGLWRLRFCPKHTREARKVMNAWSQQGRHGVRSAA